MRWEILIQCFCGSHLTMRRVEIGLQNMNKIWLLFLEKLLEKVDFENDCFSEKNFQKNKKNFFFLRKGIFKVLCTNVWGQVLLEIVRRKVSPFFLPLAYWELLSGAFQFFRISSINIHRIFMFCCTAFFHEDAFSQTDWDQKNVGIIG